MIKAVIVDDEQHCINRLSGMLDRYCKQAVHITGTFENVADAVPGIGALRPDLVFLDIQLHERTGFDMLAQLPQIDFEVIFTTAYDNYAIQAFKFSAVDYLLKPVDRDELVQAVSKMQKMLDKQLLSQKFDALFHNLKAAGDASRKITVATNKGLLFLQVSDIVRCGSDVNYTTIFLKDKQQIVVAKTLKEFEDLLSGHNFFRIHNSHLINLDCIKSYHKGKGGYVTLADNTSLEVSTRRRDLFLRRIAEL